MKTWYQIDGFNWIKNSASKNTGSPSLEDRIVLFNFGIQIRCYLNEYLMFLFSQSAECNARACGNQCESGCFSIEVRISVEACTYDFNL